MKTPTLAAARGQLDRFAPWLAPLGLRLLLAWEFFESGREKLHGQNWFADLEGRFPFPFSTLPASLNWQLATWLELVGAVMLQVASFSNRDNANRAMGQLNAAGIVGATISDIAAGGRTLFRLRVPASDHASAAELVGRIAGLGLGSPQIVKD